MGEMSTRSHQRLYCPCRALSELPRWGPRPTDAGGERCICGVYRAAAAPVGERERVPKFAGHGATGVAEAVGQFMSASLWPRRAGCGGGHVHL